MSLTTLVVWALIVAAAVLVARAYRRDSGDGRTAPASGAERDKGVEGLLAERFARGEIDDEEYKRRLAVLRSHAPKPTLP
ncbi:SHOCT domain-containing protein [Streptomyces antimicrobicus]|uniref:SHOCT domain-containing protein n=1 Tax=Streptomyces antimicrobicus TaxID=2883108 RepID=A0ABS8B8H7_9ACTN|nr:SHOCT domain-containing protein [Streptomyces antimicrobicus]MCB5180871.1 SHOCT domain-containing protein [Streptomyces antimicrobicus]